MDTEFVRLAAVVVIAAVIGIGAVRLKQPLIIAFILVGILVGPAVLGLVSDDDPLELLANFGIALLLFLVGLKLDVKMVRSTGPVALATGLGQVLFTSLVGYGIARMLGIDPVAALYIAVALTFSSTIIIIKLLSDKRELEELHGRIAVGFLIVQDIVVVLVMITLTAVGTGSGESITTEAAHVVLKALAFLVVILVLGKWVLPWVLPFVARSQELLLLFALALAVAGAAVGETLELSQEVGAFLAGVTLASTRYREAISARLTPLRDFLLLFFFIQLGAQLEFVDAMSQLGNAVVLSLFVLVGNPIIVMIIMGIMRYRGRTSFLAGLTVAQISEFSLILVALGLSLGHIGTDVLGLVTIVGLITIGLSSYMILYSKPLANRLDRFLRLFERRITRPVPDTATELVDVIVVGLGRFGGSLCHRLLEANYRVVGIDQDPSVPYAWRHRDLDVRFGDIESVDLIHSLPLAQSAWVVSTVPDRQANLALLHALNQEGYSGRVAVTANNAPDTEALTGLRTAAGKEVVVLRPFVDASSIAFTQVVADLGRRPS